MPAYNPTCVLVILFLFLSQSVLIDCSEYEMKRNKRYCCQSPFPGWYSTTVIRTFILWYWIFVRNKIQKQVYNKSFVSSFNTRLFCLYRLKNKILMNIAKSKLLSINKLIYFRYQAIVSSGFVFLTTNYASQKFSPPLNWFNVLFN